MPGVLFARTKARSLLPQPASFLTRDLQLVPPPSPYPTPRRCFAILSSPPQNFLVLRSLHQWLVEGRTPLSGRQAVTAAAAAAPHGILPLSVTSESLGTLELLSLPGSVRVDEEFIGLVAAAAGGDGGGANGGRGDTAGIYLFPSAASVPPQKKAAHGAGVATEKAALAGTGNPSAAAAVAKDPPTKGEGGEAVARRGIVGSSSASIAASIRGWYNWSGGIRRRGGGGGTVNLGPPRPGDRVRLTDKNYVACYLPFNWPGKPATAAPKPAENGGGAGGGGGWVVGGLYRGLLSGYTYWTTPAAAAAAAAGDADDGAVATTNGGGRSSSSSSGSNSAGYGRASSAATTANALSLDELYVVLDERSFMVAVPDPDSPADGGLLVCVAPLRNTAAKKHPANPRVLELRVSTKEEGRVGSTGGPGLFLPVPGGGEAAAVANVGGGGGEASFRGVGHRGIWHLVSGLGVQGREGGKEGGGLVDFYAEWWGGVGLVSSSLGMSGMLFLPQVGCSLLVVVTLEPLPPVFFVVLVTL